MAFCWGNAGEKYRDTFSPGIYHCSQCNAPLFEGRSKFKHSSPWPAFSHTITPDAVSKRKETSTAYKVSCSKCGNGLGHEFIGDGPKGASRF